MNTCNSDRSYLGSVLLRLAIFGLGLIATPWAVAQLHFAAPIPVYPSTLEGGDVMTNTRLGEQPTMGLQVMWNSSGEAMLYTTGDQPTGGGFVNQAPGANVGWEFTYKITLVKVEDGRYAVALEWARKTLSGSVTNGIKIIGEVKQSEPDELSPPVQQNQPSTTNVSTPASTASLPATTSGGGTWYSVTYTETYGYNSSYGSYVVSQRSVTITFWIPNQPEGGGREEDAL